jgi:hypothetical protein
MSGATKSGFESLLVGLDGNSVNIGRCWMQSIVQGVTSARRAASNQGNVRYPPDPVMRERASILSGCQVDRDGARQYM